MQVKQTINITSVPAFKKMVGKTPFIVTYRKVNGQFRKAVAQFGVTHNSEGRCLVHGTLDPTIREAEQDQLVVRYFDHGKDDYRKFSIDRLIVLQFKGRKYSFGM